MINDKAAAEKKGISVARFRQERQEAKKAQLAAEETARAKGETASTGPAGAPSVTPDAATVASNELQLGSAELTLKDAHATSAEKAAATAIIREATQDQLLTMDGKKDIPKVVPDKNLKEQENRLVAEVLEAEKVTPGTTVDTVIQKKKNAFSTEKTALEGRIATLKDIKKPAADAKLISLSNELAAAKKGTTDADKISVDQLEPQVKKAEKTKKIIDGEIAKLTQNLENSRQKMESDTKMLTAIQENAKSTAADANAKVKMISTVLLGSKNNLHKNIGAALTGISVTNDNVAGLLVGNTNHAVMTGMLKAELGSESALDNAPELLAALQKVLAKEQKA